MSREVYHVLKNGKSRIYHAEKGSRFRKYATVEIKILYKVLVTYTYFGTKSASNILSATTFFFI